MATQTLSYLPTEADAARFWSDLRKTSKSPEVKLPEGFVKELVSPLAWKAKDIQKDPSAWFLELAEEDLDAIDEALVSFESKFGNLEENLSKISAETFILPGLLVERLRQVSSQCYQGIGFQVVRSLNPAKYSPVQNVAIYAGLAAHVAPHRGFVDIHSRTVLSHIVNVAGEKSHFEVKAPPGFTNSALSFHTDNCEIMGLYCLEAAAKGGSTLLASSWNLYNVLAAERPDILGTLSKEWILDTFKDYSIAPPRHRQPLNFPDDNKISLRFNRYGITGWQSERNADLPKPTAAQIEAMDAIQFLAAANCISIGLRKGDILFVNDMAIMHSREAFTEEGTFLQRHLLKMLLHDPSQNWPVPDSARADWLKMYGPNRPDGSRSESWDVEYKTGGEGRSSDNG